MKGSYWFKAKSKKVLFEFSIRRNITVIKGDSATGKTTLLHILYEYLRIGRQSGYAVSTNASYYVYIRDEVGRDWKDALYPLKNTVIFIEGICQLCKRIWELFCFCNSCTIEDATL